MILKNFIRRNFSRVEKDILVKKYYKWKIVSEKFYKTNQNNFFKIRNRLFYNLVNKSIIGRIFKNLIKNIVLVNNSGKILNIVPRSCRCIQLNVTHACEKIFIYRSNIERKIKRKMFDKYKMATGLLYINTFSICNKMIFKRKVNKVEIGNKITKLLTKISGNMENINTKKRIYYYKWKNINKDYAASVIQKFIRKKLSQEK